MNKTELLEQVKRSLEYLIDEGIVVQEEDKYRLKTEAEIAQELKEITENE